MTPEFWKNINQKIYLNDFRLVILGNKKVKKSQIGLRQMLVLSLSSRNNFLVIAAKNQKLHITDVGL